METPQLIDVVQDVSFIHHVSIPIAWMLKPSSIKALCTHQTSIPKARLQDIQVVGPQKSHMLFFLAFTGSGILVGWDDY